MTAPVHYEVEVLYATTFTTACGARNTGKNVTIDDARVTCGKCLAALGYELPSTVVPYTPMRFDRDPATGNDRVAA